MSSGARIVKVLRNDLPPVIRIGEEVYGYLTRYRIISEDKNRFSEWSKVFPVTAFDANNLPEDVVGNVSVLGSSIFIVWDDAVSRPRYDIFVSFDGGAFFYHGSSPIHSYSIINTENASIIDVAIQIESIDKERSNTLTICELSAIMES
jgi:hypothetical protein